MRLLLLLLTLPGAGCDPAPHRTAVDALTEPPGKVHPHDRATIQVLREQVVADEHAVVLLYRWQTQAAQAADTFCLASTFVTFEGPGWRAQSTGYLLGPSLSEPACDLTRPTPLQASYYQGGPHAPYTIAYGISDAGTRLRVTWSDATTSTAVIEERAFLVIRTGAWRVVQMEVLNEQGAVVAEKEFITP